MEREKELIKLINVLRRTSRMALQSEWTGGKEDAATYCTDQYNRVLARLKEARSGRRRCFEPLPAGSSLTVVAMASRQLAAYYEDELDQQKGSDAGMALPSTRRCSRSSGKSRRVSLKTWASLFVRVSTSGCDTRRKRVALRKARRPRSDEPAK